MEGQVAPAQAAAVAAVTGEMVVPDLLVKTQLVAEAAVVAILGMGATAVKAEAAAVAFLLMEEMVVDQVTQPREKLQVAEVAEGVVWTHPHAIMERLAVPELAL